MKKIHAAISSIYSIKKEDKASQLYITTYGKLIIEQLNLNFLSLKMNYKFTINPQLSTELGHFKKYQFWIYIKYLLPIDSYQFRQNSTVQIRFTKKHNLYSVNVNYFMSEGTS